MALFSWRRAKVLWGLWPDCRPVLMGRSSQRTGWRPAQHRLAKSWRGAFFRGDSSPWRAFPAKKRFVSPPRFRQRTPPPFPGGPRSWRSRWLRPYQVQADVPSKVARSLERQASSDPLAVLARAGPAGGSRTGAYRLDIRAATCQLGSFEGLLGSPVTVCPLCTVAESTPVPFLAPRPKGPKRCNGVAIDLPRLITQAES